MNYYIGICGIAIVGVLLLAATACRCREKGFCRLSGKGEGLSHLPLSHKVFMMFCIGCCIVYASMKSPTNQIPQLSMGVLGSLQQVGNGTDAQEGNGGETSVSDSLRWSNIAVKSSGVSLTACWAPGTVLPGNQLDLYVKHDLDAPTWNYMGSMSFLDSESNLALDISWTDFPDYAADRMFFMLGTHEDTDGDGVFDAYEKLVSLTNPEIADSDGDGLDDGEELAVASNPNVADTDGDGIADIDEIGRVRVLPDFEWYDVSGFSKLHGVSTVGRPLGEYDLMASDWMLLASPISVQGLDCSKVYIFDNGCLSLCPSGVFGVYTLPVSCWPLSLNVYNYGSYWVAPYWCYRHAVAGDANSYLQGGYLADEGVFVMEYRNLKYGHEVTSDPGLTFQVIVPGGSGNVIRVSYLSSDSSMDGTSAVVGIQNSQCKTPEGYYNLAWDFAERGPISPHTTIEYYMGTGTNPLAADSDDDGLTDLYELTMSHSDPWNADTDGDGLLDGLEIEIHTSPNNVDSDQDRLRDDWEVKYSLNPRVSTGNDGPSGDPDGDLVDNLHEQLLGTNPREADTDGDGLGDGDEIAIGTNPLVADTDGDGLDDGYEVNELQSDPSVWDTDGDGLDDYIEDQLGTNPGDVDSDHDGLTDSWEVSWDLDPLDATGENGPNGDSDGDGLPNIQEQAISSDPTSSDGDGDGLSDLLEFQHGTNPLRADSDNDGLSDVQELALQTNPLQPDTDGDGLDDCWEHRHGFDPTVHNDLTARNDDDASADDDEDGLTNREECELGTNPLSSDTDGDRVCDGVEVGQGTDPNDITDGGAPGSRVMVRLYFGDDSGSHSEAYRLEIKPISGSGQGTVPSGFSWINRQYGSGEWRRAFLKPGWKYEVRLSWAACRYSVDGISYPDYDYSLKLGPETPFNVGVEDPSGLFQNEYYSDDYDGGTYFPKLDYSAYLFVLETPVISAPAVVSTNDDDDNGNGKMDWEEEGVAFDDDDMVEVRITVKCPIGVGGTMTVKSLFNPLVATLWKDRTKTQEVLAEDVVTISGGTATCTYYLEGCTASDLYLADKILVTVNCGSASMSTEHHFTVVSRILEPITTAMKNGCLINPSGTVVGQDVDVAVVVYPQDFPNEKIKWRVIDGSGSFIGGDSGREVVFRASPESVDGGIVKLHVEVGDCPGAAPQLSMKTYSTVSEVKIYPCVITRLGENSSIDNDYVNTLLDGVNDIYRQVGMHFSLGGPVQYVSNDLWAKYGLVKKNVGLQIRQSRPAVNGLKVYFIKGIDENDPVLKEEAVGGFKPKGIIVKYDASVRTLAHEIGHACGWGDIFEERHNSDRVYSLERMNHSYMPDDWNNGTGERFYNPTLNHGVIIKRLLMYGMHDTSKGDIPLGNVEGVTSEGRCGVCNVGQRYYFTRSPTSN